MSYRLKKEIEDAKLTVRQRKDFNCETPEEKLARRESETVDEREKRREARLLKRRERAKRDAPEERLLVLFRPQLIIAAKGVAAFLACYYAYKRATRSVPADLQVAVFCIVFPWAGLWWMTPAPERAPRVRVEAISVYPVKSCRGVRLYEAALDGICGLEGDRRWTFVDKDGSFLSQRRFPSLALVEPRLARDAETGAVVALSLDAPGMPRVSAPVLDGTEGAERVSCRVWKDGVDGICQGATAGKWISKYLRLRGCRLVRLPDDAARTVDRRYAARGQRTAFSDGFPILLAAAESLADLNARLVEAKAAPVAMDRFRPNVVVAGVGPNGGAPWAEDSWAALARAGDGLRLSLVKPCSRCKIPTVDQATGAFDGDDGATDDADVDDGGGPRRAAEPTATLKTFRTGEILGFKNPKWKHDVFFGQNVTHVAPGAVLKVGDLLYIKPRSAYRCTIS